MSSMNDMPRDGTSQIFVAHVGQSLHFRIFDSDGRSIVDTDETSLTAKVQQLEDLKRQLQGMWPPYKLTEERRPCSSSRSRRTLVARADEELPGPRPVSQE